jgi:hypothetical protein
MRNEESRLPTERGLWLLVRNATSHADLRSHGCSSAPAMQHSRGADVTVALHR